jgi:hypothetical protein
VDPTGRKPQPPDHRPGGRAVREECVDATQRLAHLGQAWGVGPLQGVVFAGDERHVGPRGRGGGPPAPEHVPVHEVGSDQPRTEPVGEPLAAGVLHPGLAAPYLKRDARLLVEPRRLRGRFPGEHARLDPAAGERVRQAKHAELGPAQLMTSHHPGDEHALMKPHVRNSEVTSL